MKYLAVFISFLLLHMSLFAQKKSPHLNHIALSVISLSKSSAFYREVIGLDTIPEPFHDGRHVWLAIGDRSHLHLIQNPPPLVVPTKNTHICFSVPDITFIITQLNGRKIHFEDWPGKASAITTRPDGVHQIYLQDPDGYWIELNDDK